MRGLPCWRGWRIGTRGSVDMQLGYGYNGGDIWWVRMRDEPSWLTLEVLSLNAEKLTN